MKCFLTILAFVLLTSCDYRKVEREVGYKGQARLNPWLAAERFSAEYGCQVRSVASWSDPVVEDRVWLIPASILVNQSFTRRVEKWVLEGGHLVLLVENADAATNDWAARTPEVRVEPVLWAMLENSGITLSARNPSGSGVSASSLHFEGRSFLISASSSASVVGREGREGVFASVSRGRGRISVLTDARVFRNRWIGEKDHAAFFDALIHSTGSGGAIGFMRGSGLSLWEMLRSHLWPVLSGLGIFTVLWLWKNMARFGPIEAASDPPVSRSYEHHLEALGGFQWRSNRAESLLVSLRAQVMEHRHRMTGSLCAGDDPFFQKLSERSGLSSSRICVLLQAVPPSDSNELINLTSDLQRLLNSLH